MWKMLDKFIKLLILVGVGMIFLPSPTWAQVNINIPFALSNELGVEIIPNYPEPNTVVFINLTLYTDDLNSADINWYKDGKSVLSGKGETKYSFRMGGVGEETTIEIKIKLLSGASFSKSFTLNPASVNLVWEANSFVPPFYKGKALHPRQGGFLGRVENIEVLITDPVNNLVAQGFIDISPTDPEIVFYENSPYYGHLFDLAIENPFTLKSEEVQILVAPYYFSKDGGSSLIYKWRLNGQTIPDLSGSRTAVFRKPEDEKGQSVVSLQIENTSRVLQQADGSLIMNFSD